MDVTFIGPLPTSILSPLTLTSAGNLPCTVSYLNKCALVSTGPKSLIPTTFISSLPDSIIALKIFLPILPKPLIETLTDILFPLTKI